MTELKKAFILVLLLSLGFYFLYPGSEYTIINRFLSGIKVWHSANINLDDLSSSLSATDIVSRYPELDLDCGIEGSDLGSESCYNHVLRLNNADAWHIAFFFKRNRLNYVKMDFLESGHDVVLANIKSQYGEPSKLEKTTQTMPLIMWALEEGILVTNSSAYPGRTTQVIWLSKAEILNKLLGSKMAEK